MELISMPIIADAVTLKKLALAKQIFHRAVIHNNSISNIDKLFAIIEFDLSTETILNAVIKSLDPSKTPADNFPALLNQVQKIFSLKNLGDIPERANIIHVHNIRNDAQHDARYPNPSELSDCQTYTRDFLKKIIQLVWNKDFDKISLADLIQNKEIQTHLKNAETSLLQNDYKTSVEQSASGLEKALNKVGSAIVGSPYLLSFKKILVTDHTGHKTEEDSSIPKAIEKMRNTLRMVALGLNYLDYLKFKKIAGTPLFGLGVANPVSFLGTKKDLTHDDAEFSLAYAVDSVLMIENKVGDIENPFGMNQLSLI